MSVLTLTLIIIPRTYRTKIIPRTIAFDKNFGLRYLQLKCYATFTFIFILYLELKRYPTFTFLVI